MTLTITAIVAAAALASVAFAVPQQVMAGGYGHRHHNNNGIKVDQQINQANQCSATQQSSQGLTRLAAADNETSAASPDNADWGGPVGSPLPLPEQASGTICANIGSNSADIGHH